MSWLETNTPVLSDNQWVGCCGLESPRAVVVAFKWLGR